MLSGTTILVLLLWDHAKAEAELPDDAGAPPEVKDAEESAENADGWYPESNDAQEEDSFDTALFEEQVRVQELAERIEGLIEQYGEENLKAMGEDAVKALLEETEEGEDEDELSAQAPVGDEEADDGDVDDEDDTPGEDDEPELRRLGEAGEGGPEASGEMMSEEELAEIERKLAEEDQGEGADRRRSSGYTFHGLGVAGPEMWLGVYHQGVEDCYRRVMASSSCSKDYFSYVPRGDGNCGCKRHGSFSVRGDDNVDRYKIGGSGKAPGSLTFSYEAELSSFPWDMGHASDLGIKGGEFTAMAWVKRGGSGSGDYTIFGTDEKSTNRGLHLVVRNHRYYMGFYGNDCSSPTSSTMNKWEHVAFVYRQRQMQIWVNGKVVKMCPHKNPFEGNGMVRMGQWAGGNRWPGVMKDIRVYNGALTGAKIKEFANVGNYLYIGCYIDDPDRDLDTYKGNGKTQIDCSKLCRSFKFFSLQAGSYCFCGDRYATEDQYQQRPDHECGSNRRGGGWRNAIYRQDGSKGGRFTVSFVSDIEVHYRGFTGNHVRRIFEYIRDIKDKNLKFDRHNQERIDTKLLVHGGDMSADRRDIDWNDYWKVVPDRGIPFITTFGNHDWIPKEKLESTSCDWWWETCDTEYNENTLKYVRKSFESAASVSGDFHYQRFAANDSWIGQENYWAEFRGLQLAVFGNFAMDKAYHKHLHNAAAEFSWGPANQLRAKLDRNKPTMFVSHAPIAVKTHEEDSVRIEQWQVDWMRNMINEFPVGSNHFSGHTHSPRVTSFGTWRDFTAPYPHWYGWDKDKVPRRCGSKPSPLTQEWKNCNHRCPDCTGCNTFYDRCEGRGLPIVPGFLALLVDPEIGILEVKSVSLETADKDKGSLKEGDYCHITQCKKDCPHNDKNWEWWYNEHPHGFRCGASPKWGDGTYCLKGTTCNQCKNTATWWYGKHPNGYYCGKEGCWGKDTKCAALTSCSACCNGDEIKWWGWLTGTAVRVCK